VLDGADHLRLSITGAGPITTVAASGELDIQTSASFLEALDSVVSTGVSCIVLDGHGLGFVDSAGLRALVVSRARTAAAGIEFVVQDPSASLRNVLEMTGLADMLAI